MRNLLIYLKDYKKELVSPAATPKVVDVSTMSGKIGQLSKELLHLEDKGKGFGDSEYDATAVALKRAQEALAAYKSELFKTDEQRQKEAKSVRKQQEAQEKLNQKLQEAKKKKDPLLPLNPKGLGRLAKMPRCQMLISSSSGRNWKLLKTDKRICKRLELV